MGRAERPRPVSPRRGGLVRNIADLFGDRRTRRHAARLASVSVRTHPTTGGVFASFASLGDVTLAEPGALIGFAGPRVLEQTSKDRTDEAHRAVDAATPGGAPQSV